MLLLPFLFLTLDVGITSETCPLAQKAKLTSWKLGDGYGRGTCCTRLSKCLGTSAGLGLY